jgi:hypothetical protein
VEQRAHTDFVLHQHDGAAAALDRRVVRGLGSRLDAVGRDLREIGLEARPLSGLAVDADRAARLFQDAVHRREPQPRAAPLLLRREERLEDVPGGTGVHAHAFVLHRDAHVRPGTQAGRLGQVARRERHRVRPNGEPPPVGHGVARVHRQVHEHLLHLARIGADVPGRGIDIHLEPDVLADDAVEHLVDTLDVRPHVDHLRLERLTSTERKQLTREIRGTLRGAEQFADLFHALPARHETPLQDVAVALDDGEQVVEVVSDAARESADRFHFLRLSQLALERRVLALLFPGRERALHRNRKSPEILLADEVVDIGGDATRGRGAVHRVGDHDERDPRGCAAHDGQRTQIREFRERELREHKIPVLVLERAPQSLAGVDAPPGRFEAATAQRREHPIGIFGGFVHQQDGERACHDGAIVAGSRAEVTTERGGE